MSRRKRTQHQDPGLVQPDPEPEDRDAWHTQDFRRSVLIDLAFVALPAIVMAALGERVIAAVWFGVGVLVIVYQSRRQILGLWRSLHNDKS